MSIKRLNKKQVIFSKIQLNHKNKIKKLSAYKTKGFLFTKLIKLLTFLMNTTVQQLSILIIHYLSTISPITEDIDNLYLHTYMIILNTFPTLTKSDT